MSELIRSNKRRSLVLVCGFVVVIALIGAAVGALAGKVVWLTLIALGLGGIVACAAYWRADRIVLAVSRARPAPAEDHPRLHNLVEGLCLSGGLPKPDVYMIDDPAPNAFVTGRSPNDAALAVTTGLLEQMSRVELEGIVAHELSHIRNYDTLVSTLAVVIVGAPTLVADMAIRTMWWNGGRVARPGDRADTKNPLGYIGLALLFTAPVVGRMMQVAIPSRCHALADVSAMQLTRYPPGLISALEKLHADITVTHSASAATAHLWIAQPMSGVGDDGKLGGVHEMFNTHPPLDERIALLREL